MSSVLHIGQDPDSPLKNKTTMSRIREELMEKTGSRYAPASACDNLERIESANSSCVFIGQPSEVTALRKAQRMRPKLDQKVGLALSFFCAGTPARKGLLEYLKSLNVNSNEVRNLKYRGNGWPGHFAVIPEGSNSPSHQKTYKESWGFLQAYRPLSTHLCPDGTGEDADIACGDPWYREISEGEAGSSHLVVRTERGRQILQRAIKAGYLIAEHSTPQKLLDSQQGLFEKRGSIWGRVVTFKLLGLPITKLRGFSLFKIWRGVPYRLRKIAIDCWNSNACFWPWVFSATFIISGKDK